VIFGNIFSQLNRSKTTHRPILRFDTLGGCTIHDIWEANLCVWGLIAPVPTLYTPLWEI